MNVGFRWGRIIFKFQSKRRGSMSSSLTQDENVVYVEYCRSCQTHSWCTHHQQAKYHDTFLKLSQMIAKQHPNLEVIGNMVPSHLIPFKIAENKYIDSNTNKYVIFPQIGSFEVFFNHSIVFSKKETSGWPNLHSILNKISAIVDPNFQSPTKKEQNSKSPRKSQENTPTKIVKNNQILKSSDEKKTYYKDQAKGFTLTDHFKMYKPKYKMEDKDWLTEKQESEGSSKQISEFGRGESREKSDNSDDFRNMVKEFSGDSKLKEMLKNKGLLLKDHGKKEMIIKLESIEEQNANDDNGITQRTADKHNIKKKRMEELENAFSTLENKFKRFQTKVKDIQSQNEDFEYQKEESMVSMSRSKLKPVDNAKREEQQKKSNVKQLPPVDNLLDRPSKLEVYLNASEEEKNQKLHRIYGEWKLLKQTAKKNKRMLNNRKKGTQEQPSSEDDDTSQTNSNSPSSNIITFKPKIENSIQSKITSVLNNKLKGHKFSTMERHQQSDVHINHVTSEPKFKTDEHFYNRKYFRKGKIESEKDRETQDNTTQILRNNTNTMSMQALRNGSRQSSSKNGGIQVGSSNFGQSAKKNIDKIHQRISRIQEQLNKHKEKQHHYDPPKDIEPQFFNPLNKFSKSKSRSQSGSDLSPKMAFNNNGKQNTKKEVRNSHRVVKATNLRKSGSQSGLVKRGSKFSEMNGQYQKKNLKQQSGIIEEESEVIESNVVTKRSQEHAIDYSGKKVTKRSNRKQSSVNSQKNKKNVRPSAYNETPQYQSIQQRKMINEDKEQSQSDQEIEQRNSTSQRESKIKQYDLHNPQTFLRKQKEWKEAHLNQPLRKQPKHISQHTDIQGQEINPANKFRFSENKETLTKPVKIGKAKLNGLQAQGILQTPKKTKPIKQNDSTVTKGAGFVQVEKAVMGRIKKNKKKDGTLFKQNSSSSNGFTSEDPQHQMEDQPEGNQLQYEQTSNPATPQVDYIDSDDEEIEEKVQQSSKKRTHAHSGRIMKNSTRPLQYYKSEDIVFEGRQDKGKSNYKNSSVDPSGNVSDEDSPNEREDIHSRQTRGEAKQNNLSEKSSNQRVEGWGVNSEEEEGDLENDESQDENSNEVEVEPNSEGNSNSTLNNGRRNSLDNKLDQLDNRDSIVPVPNQSEVSSVANENDQPEESNQHIVVQKQGESPVSIPENCQNPKLEGNVSGDKVSQGDASAEKNDQIVKKQKKEKRQKKQKRSKKQKPQKQIQSKKTVKPSIPEPEEDLEKLLTQQYTQFLKLKVTSDLVKVETTEPAAEIKEYEDAEFQVNVMYCASVDSIPPEEEFCPTSFMDYQPPVQPTIDLSQQQEPTVEDEQSQQSEQEESDKYSDSDDFESIQEDTKLNKDSDQKEQILGEPESNKKESTHQQAVIVPIAGAPAVSSSHDPIVSQQTPAAAHLAKQSKLVSSERNLNDSILENNVYSQPREVSNIRQVGVQKEMTFEVSIQTDKVEGVQSVMLPQASGFTKTPQTPAKEDVRINLNSQSSRSEFNSTVRNNFLSENKRATLQKKKKKQIERAHIIEKIYSRNVKEQIEKFTSVMNGCDEELVKEQGLVLKLEELYPEGTLIGQKGLGIDMVTTKFTNLLKVVDILSEKSQWLISRLFEDKQGVLKGRAFGVWICQQYQWQCIVMDDNVSVDEQNEPLRSKHHGNQMWFNVLEKGLAEALGGFEELEKADSSVLFTMLTGCNAISAKIKEDPTKNAKLLHLINDCLKKNYIIHAQKNFDRNRAELGRQVVYYVCSVRRSGEDQTLIELSQDGKESFWVKLSKFVQEFSKIDILHLRINHNFAHLDLAVGRPGQMTVIELDFFEEGQGCVTLSYLNEAGSLRAFLYRQEKNKVLKLVGQAKEKLKSHLFFECSFTEGRYFVFIQTEEKPSRLSFLGEGQPSIRMTEEIHSEGLNNDLAEYLPVKESEQNRMKRSELQSLNDWRQRRGPKLRDNFMESRLRETFVDMMLGRSKRS